jgi:hypothetical protein
LVGDFAGHLCGLVYHSIMFTPHFINEYLLVDSKLFNGLKVSLDKKFFGDVSGPCNNSFYFLMLQLCLEHVG